MKKYLIDKEMKNNWKNKMLLQSKALFIIVNLLIGIAAFSSLISGKIGSGDDGLTGDDTTINGIAPSDGTTNNDESGETNQDTSSDTEISDNPPDDSGGGGTKDGTKGGKNDGTGLRNFLKGISWDSVIQKGAIGVFIFGTIGSLAGGDNGAKWGAIAGGIGGAVAGLLEKKLGSETKAILIGLGVASVIFILTYKKKNEEVVEFHCLPWQAPIGGDDCQLCNEFEHCSEYMCRSLGQACEIINQGTIDQKCIYKNPNDVNSPLIKMISVSKSHKIIPDNSIRPPASGIKIEREDQKCIRSFFPLEFTFVTRDSSTGIGEPSQCKIDYNLTKGFDEMKYYVAGDSLFKNNHTEKLSLPGPSALNAISPELKNDGEWKLFIRCRDANGNFNQDAFSVSFCVEKGPDTTPPFIVNTNVPSGNPIKFNQTNLDLEVYINEPSECKWSREDREYKNMENFMSCSNQLWEMNNQQVYTCKTTLTGVLDRKENKYYFKCKDQPWASEGDRNENEQSYLYRIIGTQTLNIIQVKPNGTIYGATDVIPVFLEIKTDNGYKNGEAVCYYYNDDNNLPPKKEEDYLLFHETKNSFHKQRQDLPQGDYSYYFKCIDLGGNSDYYSTNFNIRVDRKPPTVVRVYRENGLKIITDDTAICSYSQNDCNFEIESGIKMESSDTIHSADWIVNKNYYIRCKDIYDNQPNPNYCSIIVRPSLIKAEQEVKEIGSDFNF